MCDRWEGKAVTGCPKEGALSAADQARQLAEMAGDVRNIVRPTQNTIPVTQDELWLFLRVPLLFFDHKQRRFMGVAEDRKQRDTVHMIQSIIPPIARCDPRTVGSQNMTEFGS